MPNDRTTALALGVVRRSLDAAIHQPFDPGTPIRSPAFHRKEGCPEGSPPTATRAQDRGRSLDAIALLRPCVTGRRSPVLRPIRQQSNSKEIHRWKRRQQRRLDHPRPVVYGVNDIELDLAGRRITMVYTVLEQVLNIPRDASVTVNGGRVDDEYVVRPGDEIEFLKNAGVKGQQA